MAKSWPKLGTIRRKVDSKGNKKSYMVLDKDVTVLYKGEKVDLGDYRTTFFKDKEGILDSLNTFLEKDYIDESSYNKQLEAIEEKGIVYEVYVPQD